MVEHVEKSSFWDRFWPWFRPGVQNAENQASGIYFGHGPAQGPKRRKSNSWDLLWPCFHPGVQNMKKQIFVLDLCYGSAQRSNMFKIKLLESILAMVLSRGPEGRKSSFWNRFWPWLRPAIQNVENQASGIGSAPAPSLMGSRVGEARRGYSGLRYATLGYAGLRYAGLRWATLGSAR